MTSVTLRTAIIDSQISQEPCTSCQVAISWQAKWPYELPESFVCKIEPLYLCCPYTGRAFPWTKKSGYMFIDYDLKGSNDD